MLLKYIPFDKQNFNSGPVLVAQEALKISLWRNTRWSRLTRCSVSFEETIVTIGCESDDIIRQTEAVQEGTLLHAGEYFFMF